VHRRSGDVDLHRVCRVAAATTFPGMAQLPRIAPMLATPGVLPPASQDNPWAYETKLDGQRCLTYLPGDGTLVLRARSGADITPAYPELHPLAAALSGTRAILDGEIVALDEHGHGDLG
jgi:bifunctional non-homologous end joining protein LigD